jgi:hypothetical protein
MTDPPLLYCKKCGLEAPIEEVLRGVPMCCSNCKGLRFIKRLKWPHWLTDSDRLFLKLQRILVDENDPDSPK